MNGENEQPFDFGTGVGVFRRVEIDHVRPGFATENQLIKVRGLRHCTSTNLRRAGVGAATAMRMVGRKSEKMWKRYNAIEEKDLTQAAVRVHKYLSENTSATLADVAGEKPFPK